MKKLLFLMMLMTSSAIFAQADKIHKHNGEILDAKVIRLDENIITFRYEGEDAENVIGRYAVEKIIYGQSGRTENISDKIIISGQNDWEKVIILEDKLYITSLKNKGEVRGKTGLINYHTGNTGDKKAEKKLKMEAAKLGCPFILLTADKSTVGATSNGLGGSQNIKKGVAYNY